MRNALFATAAVIAVAAAPAAHAVNIITWGGPGTNQINSTNNGLGSTTIAGTNVAISIDSLDGVPQSPGISALFNLSATNIDAAVPVGGSVLQHYSGSFSITSGATNYLSAVFSDAAFGQGNELTLSASQPGESVSFTSNVIPASDLGSPLAFSLSFTNLTSPVSIVNGSINSFTASHSGTASANPVPTPEPTALALLGVGALGLGLLRRRR